LVPLTEWVQRLCQLGGLPGKTDINQKGNVLRGMSREAGEDAIADPTHPIGA